MANVTGNMNLNLSFATLNVRDINDKNKRRSLYQWIKSHNIDDIVLQETYCTENSVSDFELDWNGTSYHCLTKSSHSCGVSILFSKNLLSMMLIFIAICLDAKF